MYAFIGGIPASGKTTLVKQFADESGLSIYCLHIDEMWAPYREDPQLKPWIDLYWNKDEATYWAHATYESHIKDLENQSNAFWPKTLERIHTIQAQHEHALFEGVNILPELSRRDLDFPGLFMVVKDQKTMFTRLKEHPRWGKTEELQRLEAKYFVEYDGQYIRQGAQRYGYPVAHNLKEGMRKLKRIFSLV